MILFFSGNQSFVFNYKPCKLKPFISYLSLFLLPGAVQAQTPIKVKKQLVFYQKEKATDTISNSKGNVFYYFVPDSMKRQVLVHVENGKLDAVSGDTLLKITYLPGLVYEGIFVNKENYPESPLVFRCLINGVSTLDKPKLTIRIVNKKDKVFFDHEYYFIGM